MTASAAIVLGFMSTLAAAEPGVGATRPADAVAPETAPFVLEVLVDAGLTNRDLGSALLEHLRAELAAANVAIAAPGTPASAGANARLTVGPVSGNPRAVSLEVQYLRSGTAVHRLLDLSSIPPDGALLAIAVAVDELLRSSWSLSGVVSGPPRSAAPPPSSVAAVVSRAPQAEVRLLVAGERHDDGIVTLGPDVVLAVPLGQRISVDARGGWRRAGSRRAPDGSIDSTAVTAGVGVTFALPALAEDRRAGAELAARIDGAWVSTQGTARIGATAHSAAAFGVAAVAGLGGWVTLVAPLRLVAFAGWQLPLRSVTAVDGNQPASVVFHPGFSAAAGIGARF